MLKTLSTIFCLVVLSVTASADTKVKIRQTSGGQTYENTSYIKGKRQRSENMGGQMVTVTQCDLRRNITIMPTTRTYMIQSYDQPSTTGAANTTTTSTATSQPTKKGGVVTSTVTTRDTGERKQMFGYTARHIITTMVMDSSPDACNSTKMKMETDGWYIDAAFALDCDLGSNYTPPRTHASGGCQDRYQTKTIGTAKKGYPVYEKMTMFGPDGRESFSTINEVVEFSQATLDPSLFDVPEGYREVQDFASMYGAPSAADMASAASGADTTNIPSANPSNSPSTKAAEALPAKKAGVIRIGVVTVKIDKVTEGMNAANLATAVQATLQEKLKAPNVEAVPIQATVLNQIEAEARQKECDYLVYTAVSLKKGGGGLGGMFGSTAAQVAAATVPYGGSTTAAIATNTAASVVVADIKARDELTVDVRLEKPGAGYPAFSKQYKGKAKAAGEDIVTPPSTQAAQAIIEAATKQ
ncbi:MAG TPA: hypothetical protein VN844_13500 [Pyrinomonadaceae bacterium]|nr:hypothetical protein [Pyrinomonadaceae bacterium]